LAELRFFFRPCLNTGTNIRGNIGIMSTPVIDRKRGIVFVVARIKVDSDHVVYRLHALDLRSGNDLAGGPIEIVGNALGVPFNPNYQNQRVGLALARGQIIVAFGSYADVLPYHGWVFSYRYDAEVGFTQSASFVTTPDGDTSATCAFWPSPEFWREFANHCAHGGIWMTGRAPAVDSDGRVLLMVGNGRNDMSATSTRNFGNSLLALDPVSLAVLDFFTPENHVVLNALDMDFGGSGPMIIPETNLVVGGGKQGKMYVWHLDNLGKFASGDPQVVQKFDSGILREFLAAGNDMPGMGPFGAFVPWPQTAGHIMGGPVYWPRPASAGGARLFEWNEGSELRAYGVDPSAKAPITTMPVAVSKEKQLGHPGGILTFSADGVKPGTGIVWASGYETRDDCDVNLWLGHFGALNTVCHGILRAYDAENLNLLWTSDLNPARDGFTNFAKFNPPTVAHGRVYMATFSNEVEVYGLLHHNYVRPAAEIIGIAVVPMLNDSE
jgi:outer membrane protein assembly factor BamB